MDNIITPFGYGVCVFSLEALQDFVLESGKEYPIYEKIYKRGKTSYKELGKIRID